MNFQQAITYTKYSVILLEGVSFVDSQQSPHGSEVIVESACEKELLALDMANYLLYQALTDTRELINTQRKLLARIFFCAVNGSRPS